MRSETHIASIREQRDSAAGLDHARRLVPPRRVEPVRSDATDEQVDRRVLDRHRLGRSDLEADSLAGTRLGFRAGSGRGDERLRRVDAEGGVEQMRELVD